MTWTTSALADNDEISEHYRRMMIYHGYMDGNVPEGAVLFIGDSITQGLCVSAVCDRAVNYGIGSDTTVGVIQRLPKYASAGRCAAVVIAIGVNDLSRREDIAIVENWRAIMALIPSGTPALFSAILPLDEKVKGKEAGQNKRIAALNEALKALCTTPDRIFVDASPLLRDPEGNLDAAFHTGDGVHLNTSGYERWIGVLRQGLDPFLKQCRWNQENGGCRGLLQAPEVQEP